MSSAGRHGGWPADSTGGWPADSTGTAGGYRAGMTGILAVLRAADEPMVLRQAAGWEFPRGFEVAAAQARFDRLGEQLSEAFGVRVGGGKGPQQDAAYFGDITIPASATRTRAKRTRAGCALAVRVSNFANLATSMSEEHSPDRRQLVDADDQRRIEQALAGTGYVHVPRDVLDEPYDGANSWAFRNGATWRERFFDLV
jgi:hypothetical protein